MAPRPHRYPFLDALRGFAIAGILLVNIPDMTRLGYDLPGPPGPAPVLDALYFTVSARFVPIFAVLFGASMAFIRDAARGRDRSPWAVLTRRMASLLVVGLLHQLLYPGEVLTLYAVAGLILMPVVILARGRVLLAVGIALTVAAYALTGGGVLTLPGLFLLGAGAVSTGWPARLEHGDRVVRITAAVAAIATGLGLWWQTTEPGDPRFTQAGGITGGIMAILYITVMSLLWHTRARRILEVLFTPLGRAAFTCYLTATLIAVPTGRALNWADQDDLRPSLLLAVGILLVQNLAMRFWLDRYAYGPLERPWRAITWMSHPAHLDQATTERVTPAGASTASNIETSPAQEPQS